MSEHLRFKVERWSADGGKLYETLALCGAIEFAEAVFKVAIEAYPDELCKISHGERMIRRSVKAESVSSNES